MATAYLSTPSLVGREAEVLHFRQALLRATRGRGGALAITGPSGSGRSRLLASYRLEARLLGAQVLHAFGGQGGAYSTLRKLMAAAIESRPELAMHASLSEGGALHTWAQQVRCETEIRTGVQATQVEDAFVDFFAGLARHTSLLISVDDFERCDTESAVVLVRLAQEAPSRALVVAVTYESSAFEVPAVDVLSQHARAETLAPLNAEQTRALLGSLFGEVRDLQQTTDWVFGVAHGSPGLTMQLAQHLVDRGLARYHAGGWTLPGDFSELSLPQNLAETLEHRLGSLGSDAYRLAVGLALCLENHPLPGKSYALLLGFGGETSQERFGVHRALDELAAREFIRLDAGLAHFVHGSVRKKLCSRLDSAERMTMHRRLAEAFGTDAEAEPLVVAYHLHESGEEEAALELALIHLRNSGDRRDDNNRDFALEAHCLERALQTARRLGRSRSVTTPLLVHLLGLAHRHDRGLARYFDDAVAQARLDIGLEHRDAVRAALGAQTSAAEVLVECLRLKAAERLTQPQELQGLPPHEATDALARSAHRMAAVCLETLDAGRVEPLPALIEPIAPLSAALSGVAELATIIRNHIWGLPHEHARDALVERWRQPVDGLPNGARLGTIRVCTAYNSWFRAEMGSTEALAMADELQDFQAYEALAWDARFGAYLYLGNTTAANTARERRNIVLAQRRGSLRGHCAASLYHEVRASALASDLLALKRALPPLTQQAELFPSWVPILHWARAEHYRLRGEVADARKELEAALAGAKPGLHRLWSWMASSYIEVLLQSSQVEHALSFADEALRAASDQGLSPFLVLHVWSSAALVKARVQDKAAVALADAALEVMRQEGGGGLPLARLLENRARVAYDLGDRLDLNAILEQLAKLVQQLMNAPLAARYSALVREVAGPEAALPVVMSDQRAQTAYTTLVSVPSADAPQLALSLLLDDLAQERGLLYVRTGETYECVAQRGMQALEGLDCALAEFMQAEIAGSTEVTATVADLANMDTESDSLSGVARSAHFCAPTGEHLRFHPLSYVRDGQLWFVAVLVISEDGTQQQRRGDLEPVVAYALAERAESELVLAAS